MKTIFKIWLCCSVLHFLISCSNDDGAKVIESELTCFDGILNGDEETIDCGGACPGFCPTESVGILEGELVTRIQLDPSIEYRLTGPYIVRDEAILSIPKGTVIKADPGKGAYIAVAQGGRLNVFGRPDDPVIITSGSSNPTPGDWGGIVICGKAPISTTEVGRTDIIDIFYGGTQPDDSSGSINHLRVEYAGAPVNDQNFDAIAFYGVGAITTVTRVQAFESLGNGIRFIGGKVNSKWLVATNSGGNAIALTDDWSGESEFWHLSGNSKAGLKISSTNEDPSNMTMSTLRNVSVLGASSEDGINYDSGLGRYTLTDFYTSDLSTGININMDNVTTTIDMGNFTINGIEFDNPRPNFIPTNYMGSNPSFYSETTTEGAGNREAKPGWAAGWTRGLD